MAHSTPRRAGAKSPAAPRLKVVADYNQATPRQRTRKPRFPLWLHATGQWAKKIKGRYYYFGTDKEAALKEYARVKDDLEAGRTPPPADSDRTTLLYLTNAFLTHAKHKLQTGEITSRTFGDYYATCELLLKHLGKSTIVESIRPDDLLRYRRTVAETRGPIRTGNEVTRARTVFRFAFENGLIDRPVRFGEFKKPSKKVLRRQRAERGPRMFEPAELRQIIAAADVQLRAMVLLAVNCGFGNQDCATLPITAVKVLPGWVIFPRPKTGIPRSCPLWPETVAALEAALGKRVAPKDEQYANLVFITKYRGPWYVEGKPSTAITNEFRKVLDKLGLYRPGLSFYTLRHVFQTIADEAGDYIATRRIMGHADNSISDAYRERFPDDRLRKVSDHVRTWLLGPEGGA